MVATRDPAPRKVLSNNDSAAGGQEFRQKRGFSWKGGRQIIGAGDFFHQRNDKADLAMEAHNARSSADFLNGRHDTGDSFGRQAMSLAADAAYLVGFVLQHHFGCRVFSPGARGSVHPGFVFCSSQKRTSIKGNYERTGTRLAGSRLRPSFRDAGMPEG
jgi:hypothetical protein